MQGSWGWGEVVVTQFTDLEETRKMSARFTHVVVYVRISHCGSAITNLTSIHGDAGSISGLIQWVKDPEWP